MFGSYIYRGIIYPRTHTGDEARSIIKSACGADELKDVCLFVGSGSTGAILKLVDVLGVSSIVEFVNVARTSLRRSLIDYPTSPDQTTFCSRTQGQER